LIGARAEKSIEHANDVYTSLLITVVIAGACRRPVLGFARRQSPEYKQNPKARKDLGFFISQENHDSDRYNPNQLATHRYF
jgi:hypothetical protein